MAETDINVVPEPTQAEPPETNKDRTKTEISTEDFKPSPVFTGEEGDYSRDFRGPDAIKQDILEIMRMFDPSSAHDSDSERGYDALTQGGIGLTNMKDVVFEEIATHIKVTNAKDVETTLQELISSFDPDTKADKATTYTKTEVDDTVKAHFDTAERDIQNARSEAADSLQAAKDAADKSIQEVRTEAANNLQAAVDTADKTHKELSDRITRETDNARTSAVSESENYTDTKLGNAVSDINERKADKATTLDGYGITDAYDKQETNDYVNRTITDTLNNADIEGKVKAYKVHELPATGEEGSIYLVPNGDDGSSKYDEYMYLDGAYEKIGTADSEIVDITNSDIDEICKDETGEAPTPTPIEVEYTVVDELPEVGKSATVYLMVDPDNSSVYNEYLYTKDGGYKLIGDTRTDLNLTNYQKSDDIITITASELDAICI